MKRFSYIFAFLAVVLFVGCSNQDLPTPGENGGEDVILPNGEAKYIYLNGGTNSRAELVEGTELKAGFGAYGYKYDFSNRWSTYRVTATPNVFGTDATDANKNTYLATPVAPQEVTYADGVYSYSPIKTWDGYRYTFFAYYPFSHSKITTSGVDVEGTPYVTYELDLTDSSNHADVMTAKFVDTSLSSSQYVYFNFYHRLSAVDVGALNFYQDTYTTDTEPTDLPAGATYTMTTDENGEITYTVTENIQIEITDLSVTFNGIQWGKADIYLDRDLETLNADGTLALPVGLKSRTAPDSQPSYSIVKDGTTTTLEYNTDSQMQSVSAHEDNKTTMLFIPQSVGTGEVVPTVTTTVQFKKKRPGGEYLTNNDGTDVFTETKENVELPREFKEGSRYYIQLTFTSSAVSINIITSDEWNDISVGYEFD